MTVRYGRDDLHLGQNKGVGIVLNVNVWRLIFGLLNRLPLDGRLLLYRIEPGYFHN